MDNGFWGMVGAIASVVGAIAAVIGIFAATKMVLNKRTSKEITQVVKGGNNNQQAGRDIIGR